MRQRERLRNSGGRESSRLETDGGYNSEEDSEDDDDDVIYSGGEDR
jgi:hypothetical protein